ncbi:hypothetical protein EJ05DRAFT_506488 [Pseudovirgaria hyperparasitica]|uniref:Uncharacterized protein n=1 Tax=Pseudovirgaria hyperparasitica TaxID=470096 RepID=A0A6A6WKW8_9PEZI|nr:uncharacterized protein EJ05DRAFT_506488 [Pseudovirgaria hyperparasitica]KAF2762813.1 hypothetical protein EJ05DRAFT_506488 [Pseudovirgaria hyperparasitica]
MLAARYQRIRTTAMLMPCEFPYAFSYHYTLDDILLNIHTVLSVLSLVTDLSATEPVQLQPITVHDITGRPPLPINRKRKYDGETTDLDLRNQENFFWGANGAQSFVFANLTLYFPEEFEFVLSMERFRSLLKSVDCDKSMSLTFYDNSTFAYATKAWEWVNDFKERQFVIIADDKRCAPEEQRQPWVVSEVHFDYKNFKIFMTAEQRGWEEIASTYSLSVGHKPLEDHRLDIRDEPDLEIGLRSDFSRQLFSTTISGIDLAVDCSNCGTTGSLDVDFDVDVSWFKLQSASMTLQPRDVAAFLELGLSAQGTLGQPYSWQKNLVSIPIQGFSIAKILKVGAFLDVDVGFELGEWTGSAQASLGARLDLSNAAVVKVDLVNSNKNQFSGWNPVLKPIPLTTDAKVEGSSEVYAQVGVELSASALGKGFEVSLEMKMPYIEADFAAMISTAGVCGGDQTLGVDVDAQVGVDLSIQAATSGNEADPFWEQSLFQQSWPLPSNCIAFGPHNAVEGGDGGGGASRPKKTKTKSKAKTPSPTARPTRHHTTTLPPKVLTVLEPSSRHQTSKTSRPTKTIPESSSLSRSSSGLSPSQTRVSSDRDVITKSDMTLMSDTASNIEESPISRRLTSSTDPRITPKTDSSLASSTIETGSRSVTLHDTSSIMSSFPMSSVGSQSNIPLTSSSSEPSMTIPTSDRSSEFLTSIITPSASLPSRTSTLQTVTTTSSPDACPVTGCATCIEVDPMDATGDLSSNIPEKRELYWKRAGGREYEIKCSADVAATRTMTLDKYYAPSVIRAQANPSITEWFSAKATDDCTDYKVAHAMVAPPKDPGAAEMFNTEHIYEGNWLREFITSLQDVMTCTDIQDVFFDVTPTAPFQSANWAQALMSSIGTETNADFMVMLTNTLNGAKALVFNDDLSKGIIADRKLTSRDTVKYPPEWKLGAIANLGRVQEYMADDSQRTKMKATADSIEKTLRDMVSNLPQAKLELMGKYKDAETLAKAHRTWLQRHILKGNIKAITGMIHAAKLVAPSFSSSDPTSTFLQEMATAGLHIPPGMNPDEL